MTPIDFEQIISDLKKNDDSIQKNENTIDFEKIQLASANQSGHRIIFDSIKKRSGLKGLINKIVLKFTKNSLLQVIQMQNEINLDLLKKITTLNETVEKLETELKSQKS